jgi:hypothetical protein
VLNFDFDKDAANLNTSTPLVTYSTSLDVSKFKNRGGKIIWYHGVSDPGPPSLGTIKYYEELAARNGGVEETKNFARLFLIPNMGHCRGGPSTDQFDMLTPLVAWVREGRPSASSLRARISPPLRPPAAGRSAPIRSRAEVTGLRACHRGAPHASTSFANLTSSLRGGAADEAIQSPRRGRWIASLRSQ